MNDGTPLSSSNSEMASKAKKNRRDTFENKTKTHCYSLRTQNDALFKNRSEISAFVLKPLKSMINFDVDRLSLQKLEYEMYCMYSMYIYGLYIYPTYIYP